MKLVFQKIIFGVNFFPKFPTVIKTASLRNLTRLGKYGPYCMGFGILALIAVVTCREIIHILKDNTKKNGH